MRRSLPIASILLALVSCADGTSSSPSNHADASADAPHDVSPDAPLDAPAADAGQDVSDPSDAPFETSADVAVDGPEADADAGTCTPQCTGLSCGDDGCGAECGACGSGEACDQGQCVCDPTTPTGWPSSLAPWPHNPILVPTSAAANHGSDNVYAPEIHVDNGVQVMWYGAQGSDGHDQIYVAYATDGMQWRKVPSDQAPEPVLAAGGSNHVNDPSVVRVGGTWRMYYTDAPTAELDRVWLAESASITGFVKVAEVLGPGPAGSWEEIKVGRPSVLVEGGVTHMWYDGTGPTGRHVGYATSTDGVTFTRHPGNPVFLNAGAIDVKKVGGVYVMLREGGDGTYWATSTDGTCWVDRGKLFGLSGQAYDAFGQVTPFLEVESGALKAVWFGGASVSTWNKNRIAAAYPTGTTVPTGGGCTGCTTWGWTCSTACQQAGGAAAGQCASPGSTNSGVCCACAPEGCEGCTAAVDCHEACRQAGKPGGYCAHPGSTDPGTCCACLD